MSVIILGVIELIVEQERKLNEYCDITTAVCIKKSTNKTNLRIYNTCLILLKKMNYYKRNSEELLLF